MHTSSGKGTGLPHSIKKIQKFLILNQIEISIIFLYSLKTEVLARFIKKKTKNFLHSLKNKNSCTLYENIFLAHFIKKYILSKTEALAHIIKNLFFF